MLSELINLNLFGFFLIFARVGAAFSLMTGISASYVNRRMRLGIAMAMSFLLMPVLAADLPVMPDHPIAMTVLVAGEIIIGAFIGTISRVLMGALQTAGTIISYTSSMANALINDPIAEQQSSTISGFLLTAAMVLIFVTDLHQLMLAALVESYSLFEPGAPLPAGDLSDYMARMVTKSFALGLQMAAPVVIVALTYYIGLGLLGRLMPQLQVFFFGLPFQLTVQIWVLTLIVSGILLTFMQHFEEGYGAYISVR